jgi:deazaflavin-dependent oxidoreductase (nitroreductase family)
MTSYIRPGALLTRVANPILRRLDRFPALIVRGRRSGAALTVPMGEPLDLDGRRYLVSGRGETHWVRNLRAAGRGTFRAHGGTTVFTATELVGAEREAVVAAYRRKLGPRVDPYFRQIPDADGHPVFRMDPAPPETTAGREVRTL